MSRHAAAQLALRGSDARGKARADYEAARWELSEALTPRQQAILMTLGVLE